MKSICRLREELRLQWVEEQERLKSEEINIAFSYWDGSGHRRDTRIRKGATISQFLAKAVGLLRKDYSDLRSATADSLMFVKEDLIIPQFYTLVFFIESDIKLIGFADFKTLSSRKQWVKPVHCSNSMRQRKSDSDKMPYSIQNRIRQRWVP